MSLYDRERRWEPFIFAPSDEPALPVQLAEASSLSVEAKAACDRVEFRRADDPRVELAEVVTSVRSLQAELSRTLPPGASGERRKRRRVRHDRSFDARWR